MADEGHLNILNQGVKVWNRWREDSPEAKPNISQAKLSPSNLMEINLSGANLREVGFNFCNLAGANLNRADLNLASFIETNLSHANLSHTILLRTTFNTSHLNGAIFDHAVFSETVIINTDLSNALGLDTCYHVGHSSIDHRTLIQSGKLPLNFLRGCGLPDTLIEYLPSLLNDPIQFYSCFISYSSDDEVLKVASGWAADIRRSRHIGDFRRWKKPESYQEAFDRLLRDLKAEEKRA